MVGVGRDLCGSSSPTLLPKQDHPEQAAKDLVQAGLEYLQRRRLHNLPGQPVPVLRHPQREEVLPLGKLSPSTAAWSRVFTCQVKHLDQNTWDYVTPLLHVHPAHAKAEHRTQKQAGERRQITLGYVSTLKIENKGGNHFYQGTRQP